MEKLLILPLVLLLLNCSSSKNGQQAANELDKMEQTISIGENTSQSHPEDAAGAKEQTQEHKINIKQGIAGKVVWQSGNHMPSPDAPRNSGKRGIQRTVYIYELTNGSQVTTTEGVFHTNIQTDLVAQVETDANGNFEVRLKPGHYSMFTKEDQGLYANLFDGQGNIYPVEVMEGEVTKVEFLINYAATY